MNAPSYQHQTSHYHYHFQHQNQRQTRFHADMSEITRNHKSSFDENVWKIIRMVLHRIYPKIINAAQIRQSIKNYAAETEWLEMKTVSKQDVNRVLYREYNEINENLRAWIIVEVQNHTAPHWKAVFT